MQSVRDKPKTLIIYFSGTGNTWIAAQSIAGALRKRGVDTDLLAFECIPQSLDFSTYGIIGVGFPVYSMSVPWLVYRLVKDRFPQGDGRKAFCFSTMGGGTLGSEALLALLMRRRGYHVIAGRAFIAPNNDMVLAGSDDPDDPRIGKKVERLRVQAQNWVNELIHGGGEIQRDSSLWKAGAWIAGLAFSKSISLHAWMLPPMFLKADGRCTRCGQCERICPEGNIRNSLTSPIFGTRCVLCERCLNFCPRNAIHLLFSRRRPQYRAPGFAPPILRKPAF